MSKLLPYIWAIADQSAFALSNFAILIMMGRTLSEGEFGAFNIALSTFYIFSALQTCFIIEPMLIFGSSLYKRLVRRYILRTLFTMTVPLATLVTCCFLVASGFLVWAGLRQLAEAFVGVGLSAGPTLILWHLRRACYLLATPRLAAIAGAVYTGAVLSAVAVFAHWGSLTVVLGGASMGVAAAVACAVVSPTLLERGEMTVFRQPEMARQHVRYGSWAFGGEILSWYITNFPYIVVPVCFGLPAAGEIRVLNILFMPLFQVLSACTTLIISAMSRTKSTRELSAVTNVTFWSFLLASGIYGVCIFLASSTITGLLFGSKYQLNPTWIAVSALYILLWMGSQAYTLALKSRGRPLAVTKVQAAVGMVSILAVPFLPSFGLTALLCSLALGWSVGLFLSRLLYAEAFSCEHAHEERMDFH